MSERAIKLKLPPRIKLLRSPIESARLHLRPITTHLSASFFAAVEESRSAIQPWLPWVHLNKTQDDSHRYAEACQRDWDNGSAARFFVQPRDTNQVIGVVSLENCTPTHRNCYLGYWLHVDQWGKGLMTEAAAAALEFAYEQMLAHRVTCAAGQENIRSLRVIERLGFEFEGTARDAEWIDRRWISHSVYSLLAHEWRTSAARREWIGTGT